MILFLVGGGFIPPRSERCLDLDQQPHVPESDRASKHLEAEEQRSHQSVGFDHGLEAGAVTCYNNNKKGHICSKNQKSKANVQKRVTAKFICKSSWNRWTIVSVLGELVVFPH